MASGESSDAKGKFDEEFVQATKMLYNLGRRLFGHHDDDILDFIQDVYLKSSEKVGQFKGDSLFTTWLYRLALNLGLEDLRKRGRLKSSTLGEEDAEVPSDEGTFLDNLIEQEMISAVQVELENLPDVYRIPLILRYYEKMSFSEMSRKLNEKEATLRSYVFRGKKIIMAKLQEKGLV